MPKPWSLVFLALLVISCRQVASYSPAQPAPTPEADGSMFDGSLVARDGGTDGPLDASEPKEAGAADLTFDGSFEQGLPPDASPRDSWWVVDGALALGCVPPAVAIARPEWDPELVLCLQAGAALDQCSAGQLCNAAEGYHLCQAVSEYARRHGGRGPPHYLEPWLAGCVRRDGQLFAPQDGLCADPCELVNGGNATFNWYCDTQFGISPFWGAEIGIVAKDGCYMIGVKKTNTSGPWIGTWTTRTYDSAMCCR